MTVAQLVVAAFNTARSLNPGLPERWIAISGKIGGLLPDSLLGPSVQRVGDLDVLLRSMEDGFCPPKPGDVIDFSTHYQLMLSEMWVSAAYEIARLLRSRKLVEKEIKFEELFHDLELLRIPLNKHEIARDRNHHEPIIMQTSPLYDGEPRIYEYRQNDHQKAHIMPASLSRRGSAAWCAIDVRDSKEHWIERRQLSDRFLAVFDPQK